jgi:hypothetical protein
VRRLNIVPSLTAQGAVASLRMVVMVRSPRVWTERYRHGSMTPRVPGWHHKFVERELAA